VGDQHQRFAQLSGPDAQAAVLQPQLTGAGDVHPGPIGQAAVKKRLQAGMAGPSLQIAGAEIAQHNTKTRRIQPGPLTQLQQLQQQVIRKSPGAGAQLADQQRRGGRIAAQAVEPKRHQHLGGGGRHGRIGGDIVGHGAIAPGVATALCEVLA
ncbi:MAG: hypothetical protein ACK56I_04680, partial [bacterium]